MDLSISEQLQYSTVRIECEHSDRGMSTGTGYFFRFKEMTHQTWHCYALLEAVCDRPRHDRRDHHLDPVPAAP